MRKLRSKGGFSLPEVLMAVALLAILAAGSAVASSVIISTRNGMIQTADAQIVGGTVMEAVAGEVRYGLNMTSSVTGGNEVITFDSAVFGPGTIFVVEDGRVKTESTVVAGTTIKKDLLPASAYSGLDVQVTLAKEGTDRVKISVTVGKLESDGTFANTLWSGDVTVKPLNGIK